MYNFSSILYNDFQHCEVYKVNNNFNAFFFLDNQTFSR